MYAHCVTSPGILHAANRPTCSASSVSMPADFISGAMRSHRIDAGMHTVQKLMAKERCASRPSLGTWPAPYACVAKVSSAEAMPCTIEWPVMLHITVAKPMAASSVGEPKRPTRIVE